METGVFHRLHSTSLRHPWPATFSLWLFPLSSNLPGPGAKFSGGKRNSGAGRIISRNFSGSVDGERRRSAKKRRRGRWFDDGPLEPDETGPRFWEEFVDSMWFLKVLGSYGWMSPLIILSGLLASRPKPFFMAFSIPLGLSVFTYVFKKLMGWTQTSRKYRPKGMENAMVEGDESEIQRKSNQRTSYHSHMQESGENGSVNGNGAHSFGGWDDLIDEWELRKRRAKRFSAAMGQRGRLPEKRMEEMPRRAEGKRDLSLVSRLLVAVLHHS